MDSSHAKAEKVHPTELCSHRHGYNSPTLAIDVIDAIQRAILKPNAIERTSI